jgi:hypothetical protein
VSDPVFSAKFTPTASTAQPDGTFVVDASVLDHVGQFSGLDVRANDAVILDTFASVTAPSTVSRYRVMSVESQGLRHVRVRLAYADSGPRVDPSEVIGSDGYVSRTSTNYGLMWHAAPTLQLLPDYLVQYARNYETFTIIDTMASANELPLSHQQANLNMAEPVTVGMLVCVGASGVRRADPTDASRMRAVGVVTALRGDGTCTVQTHGTVANIYTDLEAGAVYYVGPTGYPDSGTAAMDGPIRVQAVGMALSPTILALSPNAVVVLKS